MADADTLPPGLVFPADDGDPADNGDDAAWLASLIQALRVHADRDGHPEVVAILDDALAAVSAKPKAMPH